MPQRWLPLKKKMCQKLSNCMMSKTHLITKILSWVEHTDTLNSWRKRFIAIIIIILCINNNVLLIWNFNNCQASIWTFSKHYSKWKTVSIKFKKTFQERRLPANIKNFTTQKTIFCTFWLYENIFITLQYSGNILGIFLKEKFVECSSNILETLLCDYWNLPKGQHLFSSNYTFLTQKQPFHQEFVKKYFSWKCSLIVP